MYFDPEEITGTSMDFWAFWRLLIHLEHLQNLFFVERLLLRYGQPDEGDLLVVSSEMVNLTVLIWKYKDRLIGFTGDFEWIVRRRDWLSCRLR